jgi:glutamate---cysteine ligase / carboxylate-amine ligase
LLTWVEPARSQLGIEIQLPDRNGAQRAREALDAGIAIEDIYRDAVAETRRTYAGAGEIAKSS